MAIERLLHDAALHAFAAAMNQAHFPQACGVRGIDVLIDDGRDVPREERVQIEVVVDGYVVRVHLTGACDEGDRVRTLLTPARRSTGPSGRGDRGARRYPRGSRLAPSSRHP